MRPCPAGPARHGWSPKLRLVGICEHLLNIIVVVVAFGELLQPYSSSTYHLMTPNKSGRGQYFPGSKDVMSPRHTIFAFHVLFFLFVFSVAFSRTFFTSVTYLLVSSGLSAHGALSGHTPRTVKRDHTVKLGCVLTRCHQLSAV